MFKAGTFPLNMYKKSNFPKEKVSFNTYPVDSRNQASEGSESTSDLPDQPRETLENDEGDAEVAEEYDTDTDSSQHLADSDKEDNLTFLRVIITRSGRMVRVIYRD